MPGPSRPPPRLPPSRRRHAVTAVLATTVAIAALGSLGPTASQEGPLLAGTIDVTWPVPVTEMNASTRGGTVGVECAYRTVELLENPPQMKFEDAPTERTCGYAHFDFEPIPGLRKFEVTFRADRVVSGGTPFTQLLILEKPSGDGLAEYAYYDSQADSSEPPMQDRSQEFDIPDETRRLRLNWTFEDGGTGLPIAKFSASAVNATVQNPQIHFNSIPLAPGYATGSFTTEENRTTTTITNATITIPGFLHRANDEVETAVHLLTNDRLVAIRSPQGVDLNLDVIQSIAAGTRVTIILDTNVLRDVGPGEYTFVFERTETLPAPAAPPAPATIFPLVYLISLLPAPTAAYAYSQVWRVRRFTEGGLGRAGGLYIGTAALTLAYAGLLSFLYLSGSLRPIATLPVGTLGVFVFVGFVVLAVAFILLGALVARAVLHALQRDLDERRRIQKELERSNQELEHFAYVASHDLQEPLRTISGFSQLLKRRYEGELDERAVRYITRTVEGTDRMSRLIHDLLEYSRVDSRGRPLEPTDLNKLMAEVVEDLETMIRDAGAKVTVDHLPTVQADPTQLAQVLSNLVRNAVKYRHPDRAPEVHVSSSQEDGSWIISVADNGTGIPEDQQERAFVIFQRLVPRETDDTGTGLGLAISRKIIERHEGRIWVESDGASGSTFRFTLRHHQAPANNGAAPVRKRKARAPAARRK